MSSDWLSFWDRPHSIYVNARHKDVHYRLVAQEITKEIVAHKPAQQARVLDYGSGEALHAEIMAAVATELLLCDGAPSVRAAVAARFADSAKICTLAPDDVERLPGQCLDFVALHSVAQYLTAEQTRGLFALFRRLLKADGTLLVSDVIPPDVNAAADVAALLRFAAANGFLLGALAGLGRTLLSDYWRLRSRLGLARYSEAAMLDMLSAAGFAARREASNIGHNQTRMAFIAVPR